MMFVLNGTTTRDGISQLDVQTMQVGVLAARASATVGGNGGATITTGAGGGANRRTTRSSYLWRSRSYGRKRRTRE